MTYIVPTHSAHKFGDNLAKVWLFLNFEYSINIVVFLKRSGSRNWVETAALVAIFLRSIFIDTQSPLWIRYWPLLLLKTQSS